MKKILKTAPMSIIIVLIIALFTFNSCGGDDDASQPNIPDVELEDIVVEITRSQDTIRVGESVSYEFGADTLTNTASYAWSFVGGTPASSTESGPTITYATAGNYAAALTVTRNVDSREFSGEIADNLVVLDTAMSSFMADTRVIDEGDQVTFLSTGIADAALSWTFEGGTPATSTASQVTVTYATPGMYDVTLASTLNGTTNTNEETDYIEVRPIEASFTATNATIFEGQTVTYTNASSDGATLSWTFEGGTPATSTASEVTVTYATAGVYDVSLEATKNGVANTMTETDFVTVNVPAAAAFVSAESSVDGSQVIITYDQPLDDPSGETIAVSVNAVNSPVTSIALDGTDATKIVVTLTNAIAASSDVVTVTYATPGITTTSGGTVAALTDQAVVNNVAAADPNLFATGDFEGVTTTEYNVNSNFESNGNPGAIVASFPDGVGVGNSRALLYTVTGAVDNDRRTLLGDFNAAAVQLIEPIVNGRTYTVKAMIKFTGVKPLVFEAGLVNFPFIGASKTFPVMDISGVVAGADFVEVEGTFTAQNFGVSTQAYAIPRLTAGTGDSVITVDNIRITENN